MITTKYGTLAVIEGDLITEHLENFGEWAQLEIDFFSQFFCSNGEKVFDLGAYIGTFSIGIAQQLSELKVLSVEMCPKTFGLLEQNLAQSKFDIKSSNVAVGTGSNDFFINTVQGNHGGNFLSEIKESQSNTPVTNKTISRLANEYFVPTAIKMDIEGHELEALKYSTDWFKKIRPKLWIECNENKKSLLVHAWLIWMGYKVYYFAFPSFNDNNFKESKTPIYEFAYEAAMLATDHDLNYLLNCLPNEYSKCLFYEVNDKLSLRKALYNTPRWGDKRWSSLSRIEVFGQYSHILQSISFEDFL